MNRELEPILAIVFFLGLAIIALAVWRWRMGKVDQEETARLAELRDAAIRRGSLTSDGRPACLVCGAAATSYVPMSAASWMDRLPLLNRLFSLPPRYVIVDDVAGDLQLCAIHKAVAVKKLEEFHALLRAERARFNSAQADKVAQMDGGGCIRMVLEQHQEALRRVRTSDGTPIPRLSHRASDDAVMTLVTASLPPGEPEDAP